jgi:hypothetical protein
MEDAPFTGITDAEPCIGDTPFLAPANKTLQPQKHIGKKTLKKAGPGTARPGNLELGECLRNSIGDSRAR